VLSANLFNAIKPGHAARTWAGKGLTSSAAKLAADEAAAGPGRGASDPRMYIPRQTYRMGGGGAEPERCSVTAVGTGGMCRISD